MEKTLNNHYTPSGEQIRPWIRYWARMFDFILFTALFVLTILIVDAIVGTHIGFLFTKNEYLLTATLLILHAFFEAFLLSSRGATFGKSLFKIRLRKSDGEKLSYKEALIRSFKVIVKGMAFGLPLLSLVTMSIAYANLGVNRTSWDEEGDFIVKHQIIGTQRLILTLLPVVAFMAFGVYTMMKPSISPHKKIQTYLENLVKVQGKNLPKMIDERTRLDSVKLNGMKVAYRYTLISPKLSEEEKQETRESFEKLKNAITKNNCKEKWWIYMLNNGAIMKHTYLFENNPSLIFTFELDNCPLI